MYCRLLLIFGILLAVSCSHNKKKGVSNNVKEQSEAIAINPDLINPFITNDFCDSVIKSVDLLLIEQLIVSENSDSLIVELYNIPDWNDPGDFLKIKIIDKAKNVKLETNNFGGWVQHRISEEVKSKSLVSSKNLLLLENKTGKQIVLFGYTYASSPGLLTIIDLFPVPQIIINSELDLLSIMQTESGYINFIVSRNFVDSLILDFQEMKIY